MQLLALITVALIINVWATSFVVRRVRVGRERTLLFALIWLVPGGALIAMLLAAGSRSRKPKDSRSRMLEAIAENYQRRKTTGNPDR